MREESRDLREGQKVVLTIEIEDMGQDFTELDVLENGVLLGNSMMFSHGRVSLLGIGTNNGSEYHTAEELIQLKLGALVLKGMTIYMYDTDSIARKPLPWNAPTLKYKVIKVKKALKPNRFINKNK